MTTWAELSDTAGRNDMPAILAEACAYGRLLPAEVAKGIAEAWVLAEWPGRILEPQYWHTIFMMALDDGEYLDDDGAVRSHEELPQTLTLWRGAVPEYARGMSWTADMDRAHWFATRMSSPMLTGRPGGGRIYEVTVDRDLVLAKFDARKEAEYVIDLEHLLEDDIQEVGP